MFTKDQIVARDRAHEQAIDQLPVSPWDVVVNAPAFIRRRDLARWLAHVEIFKQVIDVPGCVVELGVFNGNSFFTWAKLMETFCPADRSRMVYGFDSFEGLRTFHAKDGAVSTTHAGAYKAREATVRKLVELHNQDGLLAGIPRCELITGDVMTTLPQFLDEHPGLRISLLYFDMDLYEPTKFGLQQLFDRVVSGGIVAFDEYGIVPWEGETKAVEEFFDEAGLPRPVLRKAPFCNQPCYLVKGA